MFSKLTGGNRRRRIYFGRLFFFSLCVNVVWQAHVYAAI